MKGWPTLSAPLRSVTAEEIQRYCVHDLEWQKFRLGLKRSTTERKLEQLLKWYQERPNREHSKVQVGNYLNALKRAGILDSNYQVVKE
jgi:hypothetical protein